MFTVVTSRSCMVQGSDGDTHSQNDSWFGAQTHGETHRQNDTSLAAPMERRYRGGGASRRLHKGERPPPFVDSSIWVSPWVRVRVFGTPGQRCVVSPMGFPMGLSTEH